MKLKFFLPVLIILAFVFSCEKESIVDAESEDLNAVLITANSTNFVVYPLHLFDSFGSATREGPFGSPVSVRCANLSGYVHITGGIVNYEREVLVRYVIKDSQFPFRERILSEERYIVKANEFQSETKPILRNLGFEVQGELTSSLLRVKRVDNGAVISSNSISQTFDFVNCFSFGRGGGSGIPALDPPDLEEEEEDDSDIPGS